MAKQKKPKNVYDKIIEWMKFHLFSTSLYILSMQKSEKKGEGSTGAGAWPIYMAPIYEYLLAAI